MLSLLRKKISLQISRKISPIIGQTAYHKYKSISLNHRKIVTANPATAADEKNITIKSVSDMPGIVMQGYLKLFLGFLLSLVRNTGEIINFYIS